MRPRVAGGMTWLWLGLGALAVIATTFLIMNPSQRRAGLLFILLPLAVAVVGLVLYCWFSDDLDCLKFY